MARGFTSPAQGDRLLGATLVLLFVGGLMLSQAVQRASELLDDRTDSHGCSPPRCRRATSLRCGCWR